MVLVAGLVFGAGASSTLSAHNDFSNPASQSSHAREAIDAATGAAPRRAYWRWWRLPWFGASRRAQRQVAASLGTNRWIASYAWSWISGSRKSGTISAWSMTGPVIVLAALA